MVLFTGCVGVAYPAGPPGTYYGYDYYPGWNIYYYPEGHIYYWNAGGHWHSGREVPRHYHFRAHREAPREHLRLPTRQPWTEHHQEHRGHEEHVQPGGRQRGFNRH